jgi:hypothetical protein
LQPAQRAVTALGFGFADQAIGIEPPHLGYRAIDDGRRQIGRQRVQADYDPIRFRDASRAFVGIAIAGRFGLADTCSAAAALTPWSLARLRGALWWRGSRDTRNP